MKSLACRSAAAITPAIVVVAARDAPEYPANRREFVRTSTPKTASIHASSQSSASICVRVAL